MKGKPTHYRFASRDGQFKTRWRRWPQQEFPRPSGAALKMLGAGYGIQMRYAGHRVKRRAA